MTEQRQAVRAGEKMDVKGKKRFRGSERAGKNNDSDHERRYRFIVGIDME